MTLTQAEFLALIVKNGIPAAFELVRVLKWKIDGVTPEQWAELQAFATRSIEYYQGPKPVDS